MNRPTLAHELLTPEGLARPISYGDWICGCEGCAAALFRSDPLVILVAKTAMHRVAIRAGDYFHWPAATLEAAKFNRFDYIREIFVGSPEIQAAAQRGSLAIPMATPAEAVLS